MLVAFDEDRFQRGIDVSALADLDQPQRVHGIDHRAGAERNAGGPQRARKADDVVGHVACRRIEVIDGGRHPYPPVNGVQLSVLRNDEHQASIKIYLSPAASFRTLFRPSPCMRAMSS